MERILWTHVESIICCVYIIVCNKLLKMTNNILNPCINTNVSLGIDEACLSILNLYYYPVICYSIAWDAYWGTGMPMAILAPSTNTSLVISTKYPLHIYYKTTESNRTYEYCHTTYTFKEHGSYRWNVTRWSSLSWDWYYTWTNRKLFANFCSIYGVYFISNYMDNIKGDYKSNKRQIITWKCARWFGQTSGSRKHNSSSN